jgi:hypothetical protein
MTEDFAAPSRLRDELASGRYEWLHDHAGLTVEDLPTFMAEFYDPGLLDLPEEYDAPESAQDTEAFQTYLRSVSTSEASEAVASNPHTKLEHLTGMPETDTLDWSSLSASQQAREIITLESNFVANIYGKRDDGKTTFSTSFVPEWLDLYERGKVVSNYKGDWVDVHVASFSEFKDKCLGDAEYFHSSYDAGQPPELSRDLPKLFLFDESSTWLDWRQYKTPIMEKYVPWLNRFAKYNIDAIHLFHSFSSAAKELRRELVVPLHIHKYVTEDGTHCADVYTEMKDSPVEPKRDSLIASIENIPDSVLEVDPDLPAPWKW